MHNNSDIAGTRAKESKITRFDIRRGHFSLWVGQNEPRKEFDFVSGTLKGITLRRKEATSGEMIFMDFLFEKGETRFKVSAIASSSVAAELVSKLANIHEITSELRIDVWAKENFTNCTVRENGEALPFRTLPKTVRKQNGFNTVVDSTERDEAVLKMVDELNLRLGFVQANSSGRPCMG